MLIDTSNLDSGLDKVKLARAALLAAVQAINDLTDAGGGGADLVNFLQVGLGAVPRSLQSKGRDRPSLFDSMSTEAQRATIRAGLGAAGAVCGTQLQVAADSGNAGLEGPMGRYMLDVPLRIKAGTSRIAIRGDHRVRTIFSPASVSIAAGGVNVNALVVIQDNNAHFCLDTLRFYSDLAYTGTAVYAVEGGGDDGSGQCLFSAVFRNLWVDFASTNSGFFRGGAQNSVFDTLTAENMKTVFRLQGPGCLDNFFRNLSVFHSFDPVVMQTDDTFGSVATTVDGVHAYNHLRGRLIEVNNWRACTIHDVTLEPDASNLGDTGVLKAKDCSGVTVTNTRALTRSGVPACAVGIEVQASSMKFSGGQYNANVGLKLTGSGVQDLVFEDHDFNQCTTAALQVADACTGRIVTRGCRFNDSMGNAVLHSVSNGMSWYSYDDEFLNAGMSGAAGTRNLDLSSSGEIILVRPRIGRTDAGAAASYFLQANGSGRVVLVDPIWVGTPPTGFITGTQEVVVLTTQVSGTVVVTTSTYTVKPSDRTVVCDFAGTVTLTLPSPSPGGRELRVVNHQAQLVLSASSNVIPRIGGSAGTAVLPATDGAWIEMSAVGTGWQIVEGS